MVSWGKIVFGPLSDYVGGSVTEFLEVDTDRMSYFELKGYIKDLGYTTDCSFFIRSPIDGFFVEVKSDKVICDISSMFKNGDRMDVYVCHEVNEPEIAPLALDYVPHVMDSGVGGESFTSFNEIESPVEPSSPPSEHFNPSSQPSNPLGEPSNTSSQPSNPLGEPSNTSYQPSNPAAEPSNLSVESSDDESDNESDERSEVYSSEESLDSDVHEEYRDFRASRRHFNRSNRRTRGTTTEQIHTTEKGPDIGYDETNVGSKDSLLGKLGGDEPYYPSDEAPSFELEEETGWGDGEEVEQIVRKKKKNRVIFYPTSEKIVWELGLVFANVREFREAVTKYAVQEKIQIEKYVNEPGRVRVRCCKKGCPWLLVASLDSQTTDFMVKNYNPIHMCVSSTHYYLCNSRFLAVRYKDRITEQPNIRIIKLQELIRKELDIQVGKTIVRRARARVLKEIMGDHIAEYGRIFDYRDEILRTNPGSTCIVKFGEIAETGHKIFEGFYVCFHALKKAFFGGTRRCIGLDGCFLKGVCRGQLLVAVCKDGNNQMLPIAWAVVEVENKFTWAWFLTLVKNDLHLGEGHELTLITDMQKVCPWLLIHIHLIFYILFDSH